MNLDQSNIDISSRDMCDVFNEYRGIDQVLLHLLLVQAIL